MKGIKRISILLTFAIGMSFISACTQSQQTEGKGDPEKGKTAKKLLQNENKPKIYFKKNEHDFGELVAGETVTYAFKFSNTGGADLIISAVRSTCGCTVSEYPKEPIKPGKSGVIKLTFDSRGRQGYQNKLATVTSNAVTSIVVLRVKATVKNS